MTREQAVPLEEDEYFIADLIGIEVYTDDGEAFGTISDVLSTGANDVYVVTARPMGRCFFRDQGLCAADRCEGPQDGDPSDAGTGLNSGVCSGRPKTERERIRV